MKLEVEVEAHPKFQILYDPPAGTYIAICIGGRGGMKTYEVSKLAAVKATSSRKRIVVLRDEHSLIKESILNEIWNRYETANTESRILDRLFDKNETELKDRRTGKTLIYTKGFRATSNAKVANLKGPSDIDIAIMEEMEDLREESKFNTFIDGLRKEGCLIIVILNTPDVGHFLIKQYFNTIPVEGHDGYFRIEPKTIPGFVCIQTDYSDNEHLPAHIVDRYESYGDPASSMYNLHYYLTAIKGYASSGRKGQILKKVKPITLAEYMAIPVPEIYGQDFGTAKPAALIGVKFVGNKSYAREINYLPMNKVELGILYCTLGFGPNDKIVADYADKKAIDALDYGFTEEDCDLETLRKYPQLRRGFYMVRCVKGADSVKNGLDDMDAMELFAVEESTNLWNEIRLGVWEINKYGEYTDQPKPGNDHLRDGWMYVIGDRKRGDYGIERTN